MDEAQADDEPIPGDALIWRRVPTLPNWTTFDENQGRIRPSSLAFGDHRNGSPMSGFLADAGNSAAEVMAGHEGYGLVALTVDQIRSRGLVVVRRPIEGFPSHVEVVGPKTKPTTSALAKASEWVINPFEADE